MIKAVKNFIKRIFSDNKPVVVDASATQEGFNEAAFRDTIKRTGSRANFTGKRQMPEQDKNDRNEQ